MNGNQIVKELIEHLSKVPDITVTRSSISRWRRVFQLSGKLNGFIYLNAIGHYPYRWGITKNTVDKIEAQKTSWCVILLYESNQTGYVISAEEYHKRVAQNLWPFHQGDYKLTDGKSLVGIPRFSTVDELLNLLFNNFCNSFITSLIQKAIEETKPIYQRVTQLRGGESLSHKELKEYVASHPELIGLPKNVSSFSEYPFPSGDQVDVAF